MKNITPPDVFDLDAYMKKLSEEPIALEREPDGDPPEQEFHHGICKNSRCTTCNKARTCELFIELADLSMNGFKLCMAECVEYEPINARKLPRSRKGPNTQPTH